MVWSAECTVWVEAIIVALQRQEEDHRCHWHHRQPWPVRICMRCWMMMSEGMMEWVEVEERWRRKMRSLRRRILADMAIYWRITFWFSNNMKQLSLRIGGWSTSPMETLKMSLLRGCADSQQVKLASNSLCNIMTNVVLLYRLVNIAIPKQLVGSTSGNYWRYLSWRKWIVGVCDWHAEDKMYFTQSYFN